MKPISQPTPTHSNKRRVQTEQELSPQSQNNNNNYSGYPLSSVVDNNFYRPPSAIDQPPQYYPDTVEHTPMKFNQSTTTTTLMVSTRDIERMKKDILNVLTDDLDRISHDLTSSTHNIVI